jgi:hypothetical protein
MSNDKMSNDKMSNNKMSNNKISNNKMSNDKMSNDKMSNNKMLYDKNVKIRILDFTHYSRYLPQPNLINRLLLRWWAVRRGQKYKNVFNMLTFSVTF